MFDLKRDVAWVLLVLVLGSVGLLLLTGRLHLGSAGADEHAASAAAPEDEAAKTRLAAGRVSLDPDGYRAAGIKEAAVGTGSVATTVRVNGEVQLADGRWSRVTPRVAGVVRELRAKPCDEVAAGGTLATIESADLGEAVASYVSALTERDLAKQNAARWEHLRAAGFESQEGTGSVGWVDLDQALADHDAAKAEHVLATRVLDRAKDLLGKGLKSQSDLWSAEQDADRARIREEAAHRRLGVLGVVAANDATRSEQRVEAAATRLRTLGLLDSEIAPIQPGSPRSTWDSYEVRSPLAGVVFERQATLGEAVEAKDALYVVADLSTVWVHAALYEKDLPQVRAGMPAVVRVQGYPEATFSGSVLHAGLRVDEKTRAVDLRIEVGNASSPCAPRGSPLRPGMFATADLEVGRKGDVLVVPASAVQTMGNEPVVFVRVSEGSASSEPKSGAPASAEAKKGPASSPPGGPGIVFERRAVVLGARDDRVVEVVKGLCAGELVCVENAFLLKSEFEKSKIADED